LSIGARSKWAAVAGGVVCVEVSEGVDCEDSAGADTCGAFWAAPLQAVSDTASGRRAAGTRAATIALVRVFFVGYAVFIGWRRIHAGGRREKPGAFTGRVVSNLRFTCDCALLHDKDAVLRWLNEHPNGS
jgi:hypothetical protein